MKTTQEVLKNFVNSKSKFFDLPDGQEATVKFLSAESVTTTFKGSKVQSIRYFFEIDGKKMAWDRASRSFAKQMSVFRSGDILKIKRFGEKNQTRYEVIKID